MNDFRPAAAVSAAPSGAAGGSLTGTYPNPTIATIPSGATATTQSAADNSTKLATTAYTDKQAGRDWMFYLNGSQANVRDTFPRFWSTSQTLAALTTAVMTNQAIVLYAGDIITSISFRSGTTALSAASHWWFALYDTQATPALIAQTSDQTSTAWGASTVKTLSLGSPAPYTVTTTGVYYISVMVAATTVPTLCGDGNSTGTAVSAGFIAGQKQLQSTSGTALAATAPSTITSATTSNIPVYGVTS